MSKVQTTSSVTVRDAKTEKYVTVRGVGALKDSKFVVKRCVDLTQPIAKQALKGSPHAPKRAGKG